MDPQSQRPKDSSIEKRTLRKEDNAYTNTGNLVIFLKIIMPSKHLNLKDLQEL